MADSQPNEYDELAARLAVVAAQTAMLAGKGDWREILQTIDPELVARGHKAASKVSTLEAGQPDEALGRFASDSAPPEDAMSLMNLRAGMNEEKPS